LNTPKHGLISVFQIRTGFQKWILRYVSECSGQREYGIHTKRLEFISDNVFDAMTSVDSSTIDFSTAMWADDLPMAENALDLPDRS